MKNRRTRPPKPNSNPFPEVCPVPATFLETLGPVTFGIAEAESAAVMTDLDLLPQEVTRRPPEWVVNVSRRVDQLMFRDLFRWRTEPFSWHLAGRITGLLNRYLCFIEHDLPRMIEEAGFPEIPESCWAELEPKLSLEPMRPMLVRRLGRNVLPEEDTDALIDEATDRQLTQVRTLVDFFGRQAAKRPAAEGQEFYRGQLEGFGAILDPQGNLVGQTGRTSTYIELLVHWPAIEQLRQRQPSITRGQLYEWLVVQEVWASPPGLDWFNDLCDEIKLGTKRPGRPRKRN